MIKSITLALAAIVGLGIPASAIADTSDPLFIVQNDVNFRLKFQDEGEGQDNWRMPTYRADCEDYALLKRSLLISQYGYSPDDLQLLIVVKKTGAKTGPQTYEGHVVLHVKSSNMILNNPSSEDKRQNMQPLEYSQFMANGNYRLWCIVGDISEGNKDTNKRCIRNKAA